jgi:acyl carrier protein
VEEKTGETNSRSAGSMSQALEKVKRILIDEMGIDAAEVGPKSGFRDLGLDSMDMSQLLLELESAFGIEIPDDDLEGLFTVQDAANYAEKRLA